MPNTDRDSMLERWANGAETLAQYYEDLYGPPPDPPQLPALTTYDGLLEAIVEATLRAKRNINKISPTYHNTDSAYVKTVPSGDVHYASLEQIGGKTVVWNQLVNSGTTSVATISGHKYYTVIDGTASIVTADGTAITVVDDTADMVCDLTLMFGAGNEPSTVAEFEAMFPASYYPYNAGTLLSAGVTGVVSKGKSLVNIFDKIGVTSQKDSPTFTLKAGTYTLSTDVTNHGSITCYVNAIHSGSILGRITVLSGDSNVRKYVTFTATEDGTYYIRYNGALIGYNFDAKNLMLEQGSTATPYAPYVGTIQTLSIPASIQALEGYGWSAGSVYNYVDFERKIFVQRVERVDLSTLNWGWNATYASYYTSGLASVIKYNAIQNENVNYVSEKYLLFFGSLSTIRKYNFEVGTSGNLWVKVDEVEGNEPSGMFYYELATPVETDISQYLTDDNLIEVEPNGTLTFPNSNGDDYRIDVPSAETFVVGEP